MNTVDVTVISCLYGTSHQRFVPDWSEGVAALDPFPYGIAVVACDRPQRIVLGHFVAEPCDWKHPQAYYLQQALKVVDTEWVWIHDIDDVARPDALDGIGLIEADVWQLGYRRSDGETYLPPQLTWGEVLDAALQDWALWRRLAYAGAKFQSSDRIHFNYRRHAAARGETELTLERRNEDLVEMYGLEVGVAQPV